MRVGDKFQAGVKSRRGVTFFGTDKQKKFGFK